MLKIALRTYYRYEKGQRKVPDGLLELAYIVTGKPKEKFRDQQRGVAEQEAEYPDSSPAQPDQRAPAQLGGDPLTQAIEGLKTVYGSNNSVIIRALAMNIAAFQLAADKDHDVKARLDQIEEKFNNLDEKVSEVLKLLESRRVGAKGARKNKNV